MPGATTSPARTLLHLQAGSVDPVDLANYAMLMTSNQNVDMIVRLAATRTLLHACEQQHAQRQQLLRRADNSWMDGTQHATSGGIPKMCTVFSLCL